MFVEISSLAVPLFTSTVILFFIHKHFTRNLDYWRKRNVPGPDPKPFIGNLWKLVTLKTTLGYLLKEFYDSSEEPFIGFFTFGEPALLIRKPEIIKQILVNDFNHFQNRVVHAPSHNEITKNLLFVQKNPEWKSSRSKLTPALSSGKIKKLFHIVNSVCDEMVNYIRLTSAKQETRELSQRFTVEVTTQAFFGTRGQCFEEESEVFKHTNALTGFTIRNAVIQSIYFFKGQLVELLKLDLFHSGVETFFREMFWKCMKYTEELEVKPDNFMRILGDLRKNDPTFDGDVLVAQGLMFFSAGTETTSSAVSFTLYELSMNPSIQEKLRKEVRSIIDEKGLTYESLKEMTYLEMCILEALRKYPPLPFLDRTCTADYKLPGSNVIIEKGVPVYIPLFGLQNDEKYFSEPDKYIPERHQKNVNADHLVFASFGYGPRNCIGEKLGMLVLKLSVVHLISKFSVVQVSGTPSTVQFDPKNVLLSMKGGMPLEFIELEPTIA